MRRIIYLFLILGLFVSTVILAQDHNSLTELKDDHPTNEKAVVKLIESAENLIASTNYAEGLNTLLQAELRIHLLTDSNNKIELYIQLAKLYDEAGLHQHAKPYYELAKNLIDNIENIDLELKISLWIANNHTFLHEYDSAITILKSSLAMAQTNAKSEMVATIFTKLAYNHSQLHDYENAMMFYQSAGLIYQSGKRTKALALNHLEIGNVLLQQINNELTISSFKKALENAEKAKLNKIVAESANNLAKISIKEGHQPSALSYLQITNNLPEAEELHGLKAESYRMSAEINQTNGNTKTAYEQLIRANHYGSLASKALKANHIKDQALKLKISQVKNQFEQQKLKLEINKQASKTSLNFTLLIVLGRAVLDRVEHFEARDQLAGRVHPNLEVAAAEGLHALCEHLCAAKDGVEAAGKAGREPPAHLGVGDHGGTGTGTGR